MATLGQAFNYRIRDTNKEPEWSSICNNVFDQYLDRTDDIFGFDVTQDGFERSSSNESGDLFNFSGGSEQSNQTAGTSPIPPWHYGVAQNTKAKQPKAKGRVDFWTKTLRALEQNAAECEMRQQVLRSTKSHPDFLSLGGCPSPPAIPSSPIDQSFSAQRRRSRGLAANGRKASQARSLSRGRLTGVTKSTATTVNPYATIRKCSTSPPKMMDPSRYRAGFRDVWNDRIQGRPENYEIRVPSPVLPASPPLPPRIPYPENQLAACASAVTYQPFPTYDDQLSPLTTTFQQAHIQSPSASPRFGAAAHTVNSYVAGVVQLSHNPYAPQTVPLNDAPYLYQEGTVSQSANKIQAFDFGFYSPPLVDSWSAAPFAEPAPPHYASDHLPGRQQIDGSNTHILPTTEIDTAGAGLGISCDPSLVTRRNTEPDTALLPMMVYQPAANLYCVPARSPNTVLNTPCRRSESCIRSQSPSPPVTEARSRRKSSRQASRHRRTKSTNSTPRHSLTLEKSGFVNFTPQDSNKILSGVAPSGSSKTKARREKEAAEKRRRLSQAAVKAVVEAGGDLEGLKRDGLLV